MTIDRVVASTGRLVLERVGLERAQALLDGRRDVLAPWTAAPGWPTSDTADGLRLGLLGATTDADTGFLVVETATAAVIGDCGWHGRANPEGVVEIGYGLAASARGRGLGTETVRTLAGWSLRQPGVTRLLAETAADNLPSRRALERAGFELEEVLDHVVCYGRGRVR